VFRFNLTYLLAPKWTAYTRYELFFIEIDDSYSGALGDFAFAVNRFNLDVDADNYAGALDYVFTGLLFSVNVYD